MMKMITQFVKKIAGNGNPPGGGSRNGGEAGSSGGEQPFRETFASALGKNVDKASATATQSAAAEGRGPKAAASSAPEKGQSTVSSEASGKGQTPAAGESGSSRKESSGKDTASAGGVTKEGTASKGTANENSAGEASSKETAGSEITDSENIHSLASGGEGTMSEARIAGQEAAAVSDAEQKASKASDAKQKASKASDAGKPAGETQQARKASARRGGSSENGQDVNAPKGTASGSTSAAPGDAGKAPAVNGTSGSSKTQDASVTARPPETRQGNTTGTGVGEKGSRASKSNTTPVSQHAQREQTNGAAGTASGGTSGGVQAEQPKIASNGSTQTAEGSGAGQASSGRAPSQAAQNNAAAASAVPGRSSSTPLQDTASSRSGAAASSGNTGAPSVQDSGGNAGGGSTSGQPSPANGTAGSAVPSSAGTGASAPAASGQPAAFDPSASGGSTTPGKVSQPAKASGKGKTPSGHSGQSATGESSGHTGASGRTGTTSAEGLGSSSAGADRSAGTAPGKMGKGLTQPAQDNTSSPGSSTVAGEGSESVRQRTILNGGNDSSVGRSAGNSGAAALRGDTQAAAYQTLNQAEVRAQKEFSPGMGTTASTVDPTAEKMMDLNMGGGQDLADGEGRERGEMSRMEALNTTLLQSNSSSRQKLSVHIARAVRQEMQSSGKPDSQWRHHRFVLDDGQSVNVSFRQADGAIQLQLGTGNTELNRLLQQHVEEIRQHLRQELDVDVDLEFQHFGKDDTRGEEAPESRSTATGGTGRGSGPAADTDGTGISRGARYLGFNTNEWTA